MSLRKFHGANSREAMLEVRRALGDDAVVISTRKTTSGVEITAATEDALSVLADVGPARTQVPAGRARSTTPARTAAAQPRAAAPAAPSRTEVTAARVEAARREFAERAAATEPMPFMTFLHNQDRAAQSGSAPAVVRNPRALRATAQMAQATAPQVRAAVAEAPLPPMIDIAPMPPAAPAARLQAAPMLLTDEPVLGFDLAPAPAPTMDAGAIGSLIGELKGQLQGSFKGDIRTELRSELAGIREWMSSQLETIAWDDQNRRRPVAAGIQKALLCSGFSPRLARDLVARLPDDMDAGRARAWTCSVLERNLACATVGNEPVETGGIFALVGPTGVGKTTTVAKLAARAAVKYGRDSVGLITIDSYRIGAQDQLRIYGKILGITVHTAQDRESLLGVLRSLANKRLVLIDTVGVGQRDARVAEVLATVGASAVRRLLVVNAAAQPEMLEDVVIGYRAGNANGLHGAVLSKTDEAVRLGGALDVLIRNRLPLFY
ncbi:flagellar biosynthesis protein FlhF [soil metagenome]